MQLSYRNSCSQLPIIRVEDVVVSSGLSQKVIKLGRLDAYMFILGGIHTVLSVPHGLVNN